MSRSYNLLSLALFATTVAFSQTAKAVETAIAHYTFDSSGNRYEDATGNGWQGSIGGSGHTFPTGVSGDALSTTIGSKMNVTDGTTGQGEISASLSSFTISFWATDGTIWDNWVSFGSDSFFAQRNGSNGHLMLYNPGGTAGYSSGALESSSTFDSSFKHVAITADSSQGEVNLYVDGLLEDTENWTVAATPNIGWFVVGGALDTGARNIDADIDDVQVYGFALQPSAVNFLFNNPGQLFQTPEPSTATLGLLALLTFGSRLCRRRSSRLHRAR